MSTQGSWRRNEDIVYLVESLVGFARPQNPQTTRQTHARLILNLAKFAHGRVDTNILTSLRPWPCQNGQRVPCRSGSCNARPNFADTAEVLSYAICLMTSSNIRGRLHRFRWQLVNLLSVSSFDFSNDIWSFDVSDLVSLNQWLGSLNIYKSALVWQAMNHVQ